MALIGYARVSTHSQKDDSQVDELKAAGCTRIFTDKGVSGKLDKRPELDACLAYMRDGEDTLVITRLSRAMRSLRHLLDLSATLQERGLGLKVLKQDLDTTSATGRLIFHILAAFDEFLRELIVEGTYEGMAAARARGRAGGAKPKLNARQVEEAFRMKEARNPDGSHVYQVTEIARILKISRGALYVAFERKLTDKQAEAAKRMHDPRGEDPKTVEQIADRFGVTRQAVREVLGLEAA